MYNAQMFQQVGLDPTIATVNKWTWDEFHTNAVKLTQHNGAIVSVAGFDGVGADIYSVSEFGYGDGSSMYSQDEQTVGWNNDQGIETAAVPDGRQQHEVAGQRNVVGRPEGADQQERPHLRQHGRHGSPGHLERAADQGLCARTWICASRCCHADPVARRTGR